MVRTEIHDTGTGIPPSFHKHLFEAFSQADQSPQRRYGGTGLGTTISQQLVRLLGGRIGFASTPNRGSVFWFELPSFASVRDQLEPLQGDNEPMAHESPPPTSTPALDILVVEDNEATRFVLSRMLAGGGHNVQCVPNGQSALDVLHTGLCDVAIVDMEMPDLTGVEVISRYRAEHPASPAFIMLTASATPDARDLAMSSGAAAFLAKPVTRQALYEALAQVTAIEENDAAVSRQARVPADAQIVARARSITDDGKFISELRQAFLHDISTILPELERSIAELNWLQIVEHAHALRGSALDAGVDAVAEICAGVETLARQQAVEQLHSALSELRCHASAMRGLAASRLHKWVA